MSDVKLEIEFPSISRSAEKGLQKQSENVHRCYLRPRITMQPRKGPAPVGSLKLWKVEQQELELENKGKATSHKASCSE